jgi:hypothetical protein
MLIDVSGPRAMAEVVMLIYARVNHIDFELEFDIPKRLVDRFRFGQDSPNFDVTFEIGTTLERALDQ